MELTRSQDHDSSNSLDESIPIRLDGRQAPSQVQLESFDGLVPCLGPGSCIHCPARI